MSKVNENSSFICKWLPAMEAAILDASNYEVNLFLANSIECAIRTLLQQEAAISYKFML